MSLPQANRLKRRQEFNAVYQNGKRQRSDHLTLVVLRPLQETEPCVSENSQVGSHSCGQPSRIGISISLKVSKRAVVRNRIKRRIRAAFLQLLPRLPGGYALVVVVHPQATRCDYLQFLQELEQLLTEAEILNGYS